MIVVSLFLVAAACSPRAERHESPLSDDPLEAGWRFACAITNDAKDRAECQERIALAYLARGDGNTALTLGGQIANWRKGVVLAEAAVWLAENGKTNEALDRAAEADAIASSIQDWQQDRIRARVVKAKVFLGRADEVKKWSIFYQSNRDYRGEVAAYQALALAREGNITDALAVLDGLADSTHLDVSSWRVNGYLLLAQAGRLDRAQTSNAFEQAWSASEQVAGPKRLDVQLGLVEAAAKVGGAARAREWLNGISSNILATSGPAHIMAPATGRLAVQWGALRQADKLAECERAMEPAIRQLQSIDQPALWALLGEAYMRLGDIQKGLTYYDYAMEVAGPLINSRPRAIACVDICLSLERAELRHRQTHEGLKLLLAGFGASHG